MNSRPMSFLKYQFPAVLWAVCIFIASSIPSHRIRWILVHPLDKVVHFGVFFILGLLVYRALFSGDSTRGFTSKKVWIMLVIVIGYGISDELHQGFTAGRSVDALDLLADTGGGLLAAVIVYIFRKKSLPEGAGEVTHHG